MWPAPHLCKILTKLWIFPQIIIKTSNIKFDISPCRGMEVDRFGEKMEGSTNLTELISTFHDLCESTWRPCQAQAVSHLALTVQKRFIPSSDRLRFVVVKLTLEQESLRLLHFFPCHCNPSSALSSLTHLSQTLRNLNIRNLSYVLLNAHPYIIL
jgi:hypothetical protein